MKQYEKPYIEINPLSKNVMLESSHVEDLEFDYEMPWDDIILW